MVRRSICSLWLALACNVAADAPRDPAPAAARALLSRLLPQHVDRFVFERIPQEDGRDVFEIESVDSRIRIRGSDAIAMATGLNWYLKYHCNLHVSWYGSRLDLPDPPTRVGAKVRRASWARHRYFLNYCCFGYSLPWWTWAQWERLIDWMALNGINLPLAVTGQEAVWQALCRRIGMTEAETTADLAGPPYLPFQWMGCLDGFGGPLPARWIDRHADLGRQILERERELGMRPVLQGFTGHVPAAVARLFPEARLERIRWIEWETHLLDPLDPLFARMARIYLEEQNARFGTDHLYAADTFIEMVPPRGEPDYLAALARAIHGGMTATDPDAVWVLQGWAFMNKRAFWTRPRFQAFLDATPDDRMIVLDLFCESTPMWSATDAFCGKPWLWCNVQSFGRTVGLGAALERNNDGLHRARRDPGAGKLSGLGFVNEGLCYNPVAYDLLLENAWRDAPVDLREWIAGYAAHRYGRVHPAARRAWETLLDTVYRFPTRALSAITARPTLARTAAVAPYDHTRLGDAWRDLLEVAREPGAPDTLRFDLVNVARQALADHSGIQHDEIVAAWRAKDAPRFERAGGAFLDLIADMDALLATREEFLLGHWIADARRWGDTEAERARCEWNARRILTLWGDTKAIEDYARKQWAGMLGGYYAPRWRHYLDAASEALRAGRALDEPALARELFERAAAWSSADDSHPTATRGDSVAVAGALLEKYSKALRPRQVPPDAPSLTTNRLATCSSALPPYPARFANDGIRSDTDRYWATDIKRDPEPWWQVDLGKPTTVGRVVVVCYFGDDRRYGFTVETSLDGSSWEMVADRRDNAEPSTDEGYTCAFAPRQARHIRVTQTRNSANTGRHLVEVLAFER